jgi:hypothetical protein
MKSYWARITDYFSEMKKTSPSRSQSSLQHRWADIQKDTSRFCGFYSEIERKRQSGKSEDDKVKDALQMYEGIIGCQFKFVHCWLMLRNEAKWNNWLASLSSPSNAQEGRPADATEDETLPPKIAKPIGRDRAKKQRTSSDSSNSKSSACLEVLQKMQVDRNAFDERVEAASKDEVQEIASRAERKLNLIEQVKIQHEMLQMQKVEQERQFMAVDVDKMAPWVRDYYISMQKQISAKIVSAESSKAPSTEM